MKRLMATALWLCAIFAMAWLYSSQDLLAVQNGVAPQKSPRANAAHAPATGVGHADGIVRDDSFSIEQVLDFAFPVESSLVAAPKGDRIAWAEDLRGMRNIFVAEAPAWTPRQVTRYMKDDGQEITDVGFSSDGNTVVYVRGGDKNRDGELPNPTSDPAGVGQAVWAVSATGAGAPRRVDTGNHPAAGGAWIAYVKEDEDLKQEKVWIAPLAGGKPVEVDTRGQNGDIQWAPDGKQFAFVSSRAGHSLIAIYDTAKKEIRYVAPTADNDRYPRWSPDGKNIAYIHQLARGGAGGENFLTGPDRPNPWTIWVYSVAGDSAKEIWHSGQEMDDSVAGVPGNTLLAWGANGRIVYSSEKGNWQHLYSIAMSGGESKPMMSGDCEYEYMTMSADHKYAVFNSNCGDSDRRHLWQSSVEGGEPQEITPGEDLQWWPVVTSSGKWIAYFGSGAKQPGTPYVRAWNPAQPAEGKPKALAALPKDFPLDKLVTPQQAIFQAADGTTIHGQLFLPPDLKPGEKRPAIIHTHGGPPREMLLGWHYMYYYSNSYGMNQYLASRGYVVLTVNYRSGIGYGRDFRVAKNRGSRGASEYQDVVAGAKFLQNRADVDKAHIGLWGGSYGGYLTAMGLARNSDIFSAGVDFHGVHDWSQRIGGGGGRGGAGAAAGEGGGEAQRIARDSSPVASVKGWKSPVLLIQGDDDRNVDFGQMIELVPMLRSQGVYFEQIVFPDEVHDFLMWKSWVRAYEATSDFFDRKLRNMPGTMTTGGGQ